MIQFGNKKISDVKFGSSSVKKVFAGSNLVWDRATVAWMGREAALDGIDEALGVYNGASRLATPEAVTTSYSVSKSQDTQLHVLFTGDGQVTITQSGRVSHNLIVSSDTVSIACNGDRGKANLNLSSHWPGGVHIVTVSTASDWYGFRAKLLIDGTQVATATNGGAFALSENLILAGDATLATSGAISIVGWSTTAALNNADTSIPWIANKLGYGKVSWRTFITPGMPSMVIPGGESQGWIYAGGAEGEDGSEDSSGRDGKSGNGIQVSDTSASVLATLSPGAGDTGRGAGQTTMGIFTTAGATTRPTPSAWQDTFTGVIPGKGGKGGSSGGLGEPGEPGGLVLARRWLV